MKKKILSSIWVMGVLSLAVFCLSACDRELDVQQSYPFTVETMPVQKDIVKGQTAVFRLYYTSLSTDRQTIDVYVEDNMGGMQRLTFSFNNEREECKDKPVSSRH